MASASGGGWEVGACRVEGAGRVGDLGVFSVGFSFVADCCEGAPHWLMKERTVVEGEVEVVSRCASLDHAMKQGTAAVSRA